MSTFLQLSQVEVIGEHLNPVGNRLSIRERFVDGEYACKFFDEKTLGCSIYSVRPEQCRRFPFWPYYRDRVEELADECPGILLSD